MACFRGYYTCSIYGIKWYTAVIPLSSRFSAESDRSLQEVTWFCQAIVELFRYIFSFIGLWFELLRSVPCVLQV